MSKTLTVNMPRKTVRVGDVCGHLEVIGYLGGSKWRCRCLLVREGGQMCDHVTLKETRQLTKADSFRACKRCAEEYLRETRHAYARRFVLR